MVEKVLPIDTPAPARGIRTTRLRYIESEAESSVYCTTRSISLDSNQAIRKLAGMSSRKFYLLNGMVGHSEQFPNSYLRRRD